jgi:hypothetical protein
MNSIACGSINMAWVEVRDMNVGREQGKEDRRFKFTSIVNGRPWSCFMQYSDMPGVENMREVCSLHARAAMIRYCRTAYGEGYIEHVGMGIYRWTSFAL